MKRLHWLTVAAIAALALTAGPAAAGERQITEGEAHDLTLGGGWASWTVGDQPGQRFAWNGNTATPVNPPGYAFNLGIDAKRRPVGVYSICGGDGTPRTGPCGLFERTLPRGRQRRLMEFKRPYSNVGADRYGSALALFRGDSVTRPDGSSRSRATFDLRRAGKRTWRWTETGGASRIDLDRRDLVYTVSDGSDYVQVRAVDVTGRRPALRTLAGYETGCRCSSEEAALNDVAVSGRYAYASETWFQTENGQPLGGGYPTRIWGQVVRWDLTARRPAREVAQLPRPARELDVDGGRILYRGQEDSSPIYELTDVTWTPSA